MAMRSKRAGALKAAELPDMRVENRKLVRPMTSTFKTTPTMIWSTKYLIENEARIVDTSAPASMAPASPANGLPVMLATSAATNAPESSWPSIAMLTTPTRSLMTPPSDPKISGVDTVSAPASRPIIGSVAPAAAQVRNAVRKMTANSVVTHSGIVFASRARRKA